MEDENIASDDDSITYVINIGGTRHEVSKATLARHPDTKLGRLDALTDVHYRRRQGEFYFDRDPKLFATILNYYRVGELHMPHDSCGPAFKHELDYWGLDEQDIEECCWIRYCSDKATKHSLLIFDKNFKQTSDLGAEDPDATSWQRLCGVVSRAFDEPTSSVFGKIYMAVSFLVILLSIIVFCAETYPGMSRELTPYDYAIYYGVNVSEVYTDWYHQLPHDVTDLGNIDPKALKGKEKPRNETLFRRDEDLTVPNDTLTYLDYSCMIFFSLDLLVRFIFSTKRLRFFTNWLNIMDILSVLPFYVELIVHVVSVKQFYQQNLVDALFLLKILRIFRILRLLRHYQGLQVLALTLKYSWRELLLLAIIMLVTMLVFSSLIFFANKNDDFRSIPHSFWWAVVTMTTLGYGDLVPTTDAGFVIGALCGVSGVLVIAFTVPSIVSNFLMFYTHVVFRKDKEQRRKAELFAKTAMVSAGVDARDATDARDAGDAPGSCIRA